MRKKFEEPQISFIAFAANNVMTTSGETDNIGGWRETWDVFDVSVD